jgi:hypothetical protein
VPAELTLVAPFDAVTSTASHLDDERLERFDQQILLDPIQLALGRLGFNDASCL